MKTNQVHKRHHIIATGKHQTVHSTIGLTENAGHEIAGYENTGHEFARHDKYSMKIDYITLECAFLLNFKSFVCTVR